MEACKDPSAKDAEPATPVDFMSRDVSVFRFSTPEVFSSSMRSSTSSLPSPLTPLSANNLSPMRKQKKILYSEVQKRKQAEGIAKEWDQKVRSRDRSIQQLQFKIDDQDAIIAEKDACLEQKDEAYKKLMDTNKQLKLELSKQESLREAYRDEVDDEMVRRLSRIREVTKELDERKAAEKDIRSLYDHQLQEEKERVARVYEETREKDKSIGELAARLADIELVLQQRDAENEALTQNLAMAKEDYRNLVALNAAIREEQRHISLHDDSSLSPMGECMSVITDTRLDELNDELRHERERFATEKHTYEEEILRIKQDYDQYSLKVREHLSSLTIEIEDKVSLIQCLESDLDETKEKMLREKAQKCGFEEELSKLKVDSIEQINDLIDSVNSRDEIVAILEKDVVSLQTRLKDRVSESNDNLVRLSEAVAQIQVEQREVRDVARDMLSQCAQDFVTNFDTVIRIQETLQQAIFDGYERTSEERRSFDEQRLALSEKVDRLQQLADLGNDELVQVKEKLLRQEEVFTTETDRYDCERLEYENKCKAFNCRIGELENYLDGAKEELTQANIKFVSLTRTLDDVREEKERLLAKVGESGDEINRCRLQISEVISELETSKVSYKTLQNQYDTKVFLLESEKESLLEERKKSAEEMFGCHKQIDELESKLERSEEAAKLSKDQFNDSVSALELEKNALLQQVAKSADEMTICRDRINELESLLESVTENAKSTQDHMANMICNLESEKKTLLSDLDASKTVVARFEAKTHEVEVELERSKEDLLQQVSKSTEEMTICRNRIDELESLLESVRENSKSTQDNMADKICLLESENENLLKDVDASKKMVARCEEINHELEAELKRSKEDFKLLKKQLEDQVCDFGIEKQQLLGQISGYEDDIAGYKKKVDELHAIIEKVRYDAKCIQDQMETKMSILHSDKEMLLINIEKSAEEVSRRQTMIDQLECELETSREKIKHLSDLFDAKVSVLEVEKAEGLQEIHELEALVGTLRDDAKCSHDHFLTLESENQTLLKEIAASKDDIGTCQKKIFELESELKIAREDGKLVQDHLGMKVVELESENDRLSGVIEASADDVTAAENKNIELVAEIEKSKEKTKCLRDEFDAKLRDLECEKVRLVKALEESTDQVADCQKRIDTLVAQLETSKEHAISLQDQFNDMRCDNEKLVQERDNAMSTLATKEIELLEEQRIRKELVDKLTQDMDGLRASAVCLRDTIQFNEAEYQAALSQKQLEFKVALENRERELMEEINMNKQQMQEHICRQNEEHKKAMTDQEDECKRVLAQKQDEFDGLLAKKEEEFHDIIRNKDNSLHETIIRKEHEGDVFIDEIKKECAEKIERKENECRDLLERQGREFREIQIEEQHMFDGRLLEKERECDERCARLEAGFSERLCRQAEENVEIINEKDREWQDVVSRKEQEYESEIERLTRENQESVDNMRQECDDKCKTQRVEFDAKLQEQIERYSEMLKVKAEELQDVVNHKDLEFADRLETFKMENKDNVDRLRAEFDKDLSSKDRECSEKLLRAQKDFDDILCVKEREYRIIQQKEVEYLETIAGQEEQSRVKIDACEKEFMDKLSKQENLFSEKLAKKEQDFSDSELKKAREFKDIISSKEKEFENEIIRIKYEYSVMSDRTEKDLREKMDKEMKDSLSLKEKEFISQLKNKDNELHSLELQKDELKKDLERERLHFDEVLAKSKLDFQNDNDKKDCQYKELLEKEKNLFEVRLHEQKCEFENRLAAKDELFKEQGEENAREFQAHLRHQQEEMQAICDGHDEDYRHKLEEKDRAFSEMQTKFVEIERELTRESTARLEKEEQLREALSAREAAYEKEVEYQKEVLSLKMTVETKHSDMAAAVEMYKEQISSLESEIVSMKKNAEEQAQENISIVESVRNENRRLVIDNERNCSLLHERALKIDELNAALSDVTFKLDRQTEIERQLLVIENEIQGKQSELEQAKADYLNMVGQNTTLKSSLETVQLEYESFKTKANEMKILLVEKDTQMSIRDSEIKSLVANLQMERNRADDLKRVCDDLEAASLAEKQNGSLLKQRLESFSEECVANREMCRAQRDTIADMQKQISGGHEKLQQLELTYKTDIEGLREEKEQMQERIRECDERHKRDSRDKEAKISQLNAECDDYKAKIETLETNQTDMEHEHFSAKSKFEVVYKQLNERYEQEIETYKKRERDMAETYKRRVTAKLTEQKNQHSERELAMMSELRSWVEKGEVFQKTSADNETLKAKLGQYKERLRTQHNKIVQQDAAIKAGNESSQEYRSAIERSAKELSDVRRRLDESEKRRASANDREQTLTNKCQRLETSVRSYEVQLQQSQRVIQNYKQQLEMTSDAMFDTGRSVTLPRSHSQLPGRPSLGSSSTVTDDWLHQPSKPTNQTTTIDPLAVPVSDSSLPRTSHRLSLTSINSGGSTTSTTGVGGLLAWENEEEPDEFEWNRLNELQRRNTLCRPHLRTVYPTEIDRNATNMTENELRAGTVAVVDVQPSPRQRRRNTFASATTFKSPKSLRTRIRNIAQKSTPKKGSDNKENNGNDSVAFNIPLSPHHGSIRPHKMSHKVRKPLASTSNLPTTTDI